MKLIMENWRNFQKQKINESMEEVGKLIGDLGLDPEKVDVDQLISIAHQYAAAISAVSAPKAYNSLREGSPERQFVDALIAINFKKFGSNIGRDQSYASKSNPTPQDDLEVV